jgi:hypothetical protein
VPPRRAAVTRGLGRRSPGALAAHEAAWLEALGTKVATAEAAAAVEAAAAAEAEPKAGRGAELAGRTLIAAARDGDVAAGHVDPSHARGPRPAG